MTCQKRMRAVDGKQEIYLEWPEDEENATTEDQSTTRKQRTQISGARKIWETHSSATTRAVSKAIATLAKVSDSNFRPLQMRT